MKKIITLFDDDKNIRLTHLSDADYGCNFELTDENMQHTYFTENQLLDLQKMITEMLETVNKRDY